MASAPTEPLVNEKRAAFRVRPQLTILAMGLAAAALLVLPGTTVTTAALDRLFLIFDDIHRLGWGEVPSRDFETSLGPVAYYLPLWGHRLAGSYGGAMPAAMGAATIALAAIAAHVLSSRLRPFLALLLAAFLLLILAAPNNLGDPLNFLSFATFQNRLAWVALALLLVMHLEPARPRSDLTILDATCAALLTLLVIYTRAIHGLVAFAFLLLMLTDGRQRRWAALALAAVGLAAGIVELIWGASAEYARDAWMSVRATGLVRSVDGQAVDLFLGNLTDFLLLTLIASIALWHRFRSRHLVYFIFCGLAGFWLINHTEQRWGILSVHAAAFAAAEIALRRMDRFPPFGTGTWINEGGVKLFALALVLPTVLHAGTALGLHTVVASFGGGRTVEIGEIDRVRLVDLGTGGAYGGSLWYLDVVDDGIRMIADTNAEPAPLVVLGAADPFSAALNLPPVERDTRRQATMVGDAQDAPEDMVGDAGFVMERVGAGEAGPIGEIYLPFVRRTFDLVAESEHWRLYRRRPSARAAAAR